jgi:hypothetical protein
MLQLVLIVLPISLSMEQNVFVSKDSIQMEVNVLLVRPTAFNAQLLNV